MHLAVALAVALAWNGPGADPQTVHAPAPHTRRAAQPFVPALAEVDTVRLVPATGSIPAQAVVSWRAEAPDNTQRGGLTIWERSGQARWRRIYRVRRPPNLPRPGFEAADVTGDGHVDLLLLMSNGSAHLCGARRLLALERGRVRSIWSTADACDPPPRLQDHALVLDTPEGIEDSICCPAFRRHRVLRWDGTRMRVVLDQWYPFCLIGGEYCGFSGSRRPLKFVLHEVNWWDQLRGVATARDANRAHVELLATTADGGRSWTYVLATFLYLRAPRLLAHGRVAVVGMRCRRACVPAQIFRGERFGALWTHGPIAPR